MEKLLLRDPDRNIRNAQVQLVEKFLAGENMSPESLKTSLEHAVEIKHSQLSKIILKECE